VGTTADELKVQRRVAIIMPIGRMFANETLRKRLRTGMLRDSNREMPIRTGRYAVSIESTVNIGIRMNARVASVEGTVVVKYTIAASTSMLRIMTTTAIMEITGA
jgi:hypothetical protein